MIQFLLLPGAFRASLLRHGKVSRRCGERPDSTAGQATRPTKPWELPRGKGGKPLRTLPDKCGRKDAPSRTSKRRIQPARIGTRMRQKQGRASRVCAGFFSPISAPSLAHCKSVSKLRRFFFHAGVSSTPSKSQSVSASLDASDDRRINGGYQLKMLRTAKSADRATRYLVRTGTHSDLFR